MKWVREGEEKPVRATLYTYFGIDWKRKNTEICTKKKNGRKEVVL
jgi:hypothetical protein